MARMPLAMEHLALAQAQELDLFAEGFFHLPAEGDPMVKC